MYTPPVETLTPSNFDSLVLSSSETWLVKFYAPWCGHCKSSAPAFSRAAEKLHGVAKLGVVDCDEHQALAQRFGIQGFPSIKIFKGVGKKERRPSDYNLARTAKAFVDHIKYVMPSFVARVKESGLDAFFSDQGKLPHVLLFTDKSSTSPLYKGLSAKFKNRIALGEVKKAEGGIVKKYNIEKFPTLISFKTGESKVEEALKFGGGLDPKALISYFDSIAGGNATESADDDAEEEKRDASEKVFAQPKAYSGDVDLITSTKVYETLCDARKDGRMCGLVLLPGGMDHALASELKPIAERFQYDNMAFAVIDSESEGGKLYADMFEMKEGLLVMRARKRKYSKMEGVDADKVVAFLERVVGGDARWTKQTGDLPVWEDVVEEEVKEDVKEQGEEEAKEEGGVEADEGKCGAKPPKDGESCGKGKEKEDL